MPRPKGSKNKKTLEQINNGVLDAKKIAGKIGALHSEIETLEHQLKDKKQELKQLLKMQEKAEQLAAEKKAEEDRKRIIEAVMKSGKSVEEILELLK